MSILPSVAVPDDIKHNVHLFRDAIALIPDSPLPPDDEEADADWELLDPADDDLEADDLDADADLDWWLDDEPTDDVPLPDEEDWMSDDDD